MILVLLGTENFFKESASLDIQVNDRGSNLSGGQKQIIALVRSLINKPSVLFLDEPTSSMDTNLEGKVIQGLNTLWKEKTTLLITHKISLVTVCDRVIVLEKGKIVWDGKTTDYLNIAKICKHIFIENIHIIPPDLIPILDMLNPNPIQEMPNRERRPFDPEKRRSFDPGKNQVNPLRSQKQTPKQKQSHGRAAIYRLGKLVSLRDSGHDTWKYTYKSRGESKENRGIIEGESKRESRENRRRIEAESKENRRRIDVPIRFCCHFPHAFGIPRIFI